jgi:hypothetical protein
MEWFRANKYPRNFFQSKQNYRVFLDKVAHEYQIKFFADWQRISHSLIRNAGGKVSFHRIFIDNLT